jgi:hypothetical protein
LQKKACENRGKIGELTKGFPFGISPVLRQKQKCAGFCKKSCFFFLGNASFFMDRELFVRFGEKNFSFYLFPHLLSFNKLSDSEDSLSDTVEENSENDGNRKSNQKNKHQEVKKAKVEEEGKPEAPNADEEKTVDEVLEELNVSKEGLSTAEAGERLARYGPNQIEEPRVNPLVQFLLFFWNPLSWAMEVAVILSAILGDWLDVGLIVALLFVNACLGFWEVKKKNQRKKKLSENTFVVSLSHIRTSNRNTMLRVLFKLSESN